MKRYGQHCPISRAAELLTEQWTLLVIRECLYGSERLSDIARGVPAMSTTLLSTRLRTLEEAGLVEREDDVPRDPAYRLTRAGRELAPIVEGLGRWGQRWLPRPRLRDYDPGVLVLDISREIDRSELPVRPIAVHIAFADGTPPRQWWLVLGRAHTRVARHRPDVDVALRIECTVAALTDVWLGHLSWLQAVREDAIRFVGERDTARTVLGWIRTSHFAMVRRGGADDIPTSPVVTDGNAAVR
ncbi:MAG TPA: helix-turn-helix domain-containing protein [Pseudonocardiaceae bacterium]|nr:helix-turn-helix domain-containing protein [Pseudonocardiaceae bacterium]